MKRKLLQVRKMLLVAAGLLVGMSSWAEDYSTSSTEDGVITTNFYFNLYAGKVNRTESIPMTLSTFEQTTADNQKVYAVNDFSDFLFYNYLATADAYLIRRASSSTPTITSTSDGIFCISKNTYYVSIVNLHVGDKITILSSGGADGVTLRSTNATYDVEGEATTVTVGTQANIGELTITSGTQLDLQMGRSAANNHHIGAIQIVSKYDALTNPTLEQTAAGATTTIKISAGKCNNTNSTVTTYYTTDGTEPSAENYAGSFTDSEKSIDITSATTIKAISVTAGEFGGSSYVVSGDFVAEEATLNAPQIALTGFTLSNGVYNPVYTFSSDQTDIPGYTTQKLTYTYSINSTENTGNTYTAQETGTLTVTVSATGFKPSSSSVEIACANYYKTYVFDSTTDITKNEGATTANTMSNIDNTGCDYYALEDCTYKIRNDIKINGFRFAWAITNKKPYSLYTRAGAGSIGYSLKEGEYIEFTNNGAPVIANSSTSSTSFAQWQVVKQINIYTPAGDVVPATIGETGYATFASTAALDLDNLPDGITVYSVSDVSGTSVFLTSATGQVEAGTGLILEGTAKVTYYISVAASGNEISGNKLVGCPNGAENVKGTGLYVLVNNDGTAEFQQLDVNAANIPAGKAYLDMAEAAGVRTLSIVIAGETTGIAEVATADAENGAVYNLSGQRVSKPANGLYIVNGKKVIIK